MIKPDTKPLKLVILIKADGFINSLSLLTDDQFPQPFAGETFGNPQVIVMTDRMEKIRVPDACPLPPNSDQSLFEIQVLIPIIDDLLIVPPYHIKILPPRANPPLHIPPFPVRPERRSAQENMRVPEELRIYVRRKSFPRIVVCVHTANNVPRRQLKSHVFSMTDLKKF